jgi:hypothetical protein
MGCGVLVGGGGFGVAVAAGGRGAEVGVGGAGVEVGGAGSVAVGGGVVGSGVDVGSGVEVAVGGVTGVEVKVGTKVLVGVGVDVGARPSISGTEQPISTAALSATVKMTRHFLVIWPLSLPYSPHYRRITYTVQIGASPAGIACLGTFRGLQVHRMRVCGLSRQRSLGAPALPQPPHQGGSRPGRERGQAIQMWKLETAPTVQSTCLPPQPIRLVLPATDTSASN